MAASSIVASTGVLSLEQFNEGVKAFVEISNKLSDGWELVHAANDHNVVYAKKKVYKNVDINNVVETHPEITDKESNVLQEMELLEDDDSAVLQEVTISNSNVKISSAEFCSFEYHIVYSASYNLPVLYINAYKNNGKLISLDEIWTSVPKYYQDRLKHERWTFITQVEHPVTCMPFYQLHPCHTHDLMAAIGVVNIDSSPNTTVKDPVSVACSSDDITMKCVQTKVHELEVNTSNKCLSVSEIAESATVTETDSKKPVASSLDPISYELRSPITTPIDSCVGYRYIVGWLSAVSPVVHLNVSLQFASYI